MENQYHIYESYRGSVCVMYSVRVSRAVRYVDWLTAWETRTQYIAHTDPR